MNLLHQQNMTYKLVIFDFDGTIADTSPGIIDSHIYTLKSMGRISYIYPILWRFGLIRVPEAIEKKMGKQR